MGTDRHADDPRPGNPSRSRDHFRWDDRHHQPHTDMGKWEKFWASRADAAQFLRLLGRNVAKLGPVVRLYRALLREEPPSHPVAAHAFGVAVSPTAATWGRYLERIRDLDARALLIRVPAWAPESVFDLHDELARLRAAGTRFTFTLLQNRDMVNDPARWHAFVREAAGRLADLDPTFQLGHAINRKKWGVWHPDEYVRLMEAAASAREDFPGTPLDRPPGDRLRVLLHHPLPGRRAARSTSTASRPCCTWTGAARPTTSSTGTSTCTGRSCCCAP